MLTNILSDLLKKGFSDSGYSSQYGEVVKSARPDLCQFQCNGAMSAAKEYKKPPFVISDEVVNNVKENKSSSGIIKKIETVRPGFINITLTDEFITEYVNTIYNDSNLGCKKTLNPQKIVLDYGGPNIAKPLHVGHLRTAIIGEALKRLFRFLGHEVIGDIHLGDWGLQMGMIISECERRFPALSYFDDKFVGEYPSDPPFNLEDLEEIYPLVSALTKEDPEVMAKAKEATFKLQNGHKGYLALWNHIVNVSLNDIRKNYEKLDVSFDLWYGESTSNSYVEDVVNILKDKGVVYESDGALVVDVSEDGDEIDIPPMLVYKSDGSILYSTTDLATIYQRKNDFNPDAILYVVDNRQSTHFKQVFRCAQKNDIIDKNVSLEHIGFGTMNGKDGKPFKTRDGGTIKLSDLINMVEENAKSKIRDKDDIDINEISRIVGLATLKFADLSNFRTKDYIFDLDKFSSFEGKTGPYILYTYVRINNIIKKLEEINIKPESILIPASDVERDINLKISELPHYLNLAFVERAPNYICEYIYELSTLVNTFYHKHHIINETNVNQQKSWMALLILVQKILIACLDILGMPVPEKM